MESERQREYIKQQQQLRAMAKSTANKPLSADSMIEDLLSKKETFQKRKEMKSPQGISAWLIPGSGAVHPVYERIWTGVQKGNFADTQILSRLLMTSGLSTDSLGFIWSLANQTLAGMLTQQEVYFVLALVALAQTGYIVSNIAALNHFPQPPVPKLDLSVLPVTQKDLPLLAYNNTTTESLLSNISNTLTPKVVTPLCAVNLLDSQANTNNIVQSQLIQNTVATPSVLWGVPKPETVSIQNTEKIGISYVSSGGLSLQDPLHTVTSNFGSGVVPQVSNSFGGSLSLAGVANISKPPDLLNTQSKQLDTEVLSESFNNLSLEKSHSLKETHLSCDNFDDEFTDFQSAYTLPVHDKNDKSTDGTVKNTFENLPKQKSETHRNVDDNDNDDNDDEFTGFQNALSFSEHAFNAQVKTFNALSTPNVQSAKEDKISSKPDFLCRDQNLNNENSGKPQDNCDQGSGIYHTAGKPMSSDFPVTPEKPLDKYQVIHEVFESSGFEDKCSVFHNPLPEIINDSEDRTQSVDNNLNFFQNSFFSESEQPSNISSSLSFDLPKIDKSYTGRSITTEEDSNMFGLPKNETKMSQNYDKYDAFKASVLELSNSDRNNTHVNIVVCSDTETNIQEEEEYTDFQSSHVTVGLSHDTKPSEDDIKFETPFSEFRSNIDSNVSDFQKSESLNIVADVNEATSVQNVMTSSKINPYEQMLTQIPDSLKSSAMMSGVEDKYSALRILEPTSNDADDFGDFLGADTQSTLPNISKSTTESIQVRCLEACLRLLQAGHSILNSASSSEVLSEVLSDPRATTYLDCLLEVQRVSERILSNIEYENVYHLRNDIQKAWKELSPFYEYSEHIPVPETTGAVCSLCQSDTGPSPIKYGLCTFHAPCANLYMHCVDPVLPNFTAVK